MKNHCNTIFNIILSLISALLNVKEYHSLLCLLCPDFPMEVVQKTAGISFMEDALDSLTSFADFIYAFQIQFYFEGMLIKSHGFGKVSGEKGGTCILT